MIPIKVDLIKKAKRPGYAMKPEYITIHQTGNTSKGANAEMHNRYVHNVAPNPSWHYTVDDKEIYQHLPLDENGWHAGDGTNGTGNRKSISIEICVNRDGNLAWAEANAAWLAAKLIKEVGSLKPFSACMKQHYDWSKKNCPAQIRGRKNGWAEFLGQVEGLLGLDTSTAAAGGALYRVQVGAYAVKANAEAALKKAQAAGFKDAFITTTAGASTAPAPVPKPEPTPAPKPATIKVGSRVRVKAGAKDYNGVQLASFVYSRVYSVIQITGDRVVIGEGKAVTAAVHKIDLELS